MTYGYEAGVASATLVLDPPLLFETKLREARPAGETLPRPRLTDVLRGSRDTLVLLSAPPGFGKTTLLAQWRELEDRPVASVSLDARDNDPALFWSYVVEAIRRIDPRFGDSTAAALRAPRPDLLDRVVPSVLKELESFEEEIVIVLDDLQEIESRSLHESLERFVDLRPPNVTLALSTRSDPPIPLGRLRALGGLVELRAVELCFTEAEQAALMNDRLQLSLSAEDLTVLYERTEGWPVGVRLASLSLGAVTDRAALVSQFGGSSRHVVDYLTEVVLDNLDADLRRFLLETSILQSMSGRLCDAVTERHGSAELLVELEHSNLFLVSLDDRRHRYRYHHLFREMLRSHLERSEPDVVPELHRRAAEWFAAEGLGFEAIHHALRAGDVETAIRLACDGWLELVDSGRAEPFLRVLEEFPAEVSDGNARLALVRSWALSLLNRREEALEARDAVRAELDPADAALVRATFPWGDVDNALAAAVEAGELDRGRSRAWKASARLALGWTRYLAGDVDGASGPLRQAAHQAVRGEQWLVAAAAKALLARLSLDGGDVPSADTLAQDAVRTVEDHELAAEALSGVAQVSLGAVRARQGEPEDAWRLLEEGISRLRVRGEELYVADGLLVAAPVRRALGEPQAARELLAEARDLVESCRDAGVLGSRLEDVARTLTPAHRRIEGDSDLTEREREVLQYLADGLAKREIGQTLFLSFNTIHSHTKSIYQKLRVSSRAAAIERAHELGVL